ncbi:hypothetical protein JQ629_14265 [Bradyrhizobium sp. AUGA SZCCT0222]|uniref:hypothetical protein n=1 Tax=Bradyrhizobium sp. AUGA SZCCT0222 TaxID=2807668 RepID=UPI001BA4A508|nr:hypothetical protein [Bradyrhizobium sp. AUGA SZCCT0222]MBR1268679.1 hypothetical protein [Bradyrhizobium sp. AUGA SZCCT0222]
MSDEALAAYRAAFRRPEVRHAMMQDYRAGASVDHEHDLADRAAGLVLDCPVLVLWEQGRLRGGNAAHDLAGLGHAGRGTSHSPAAIFNPRSSRTPCSTRSARFLLDTCADC